MFGKLLERAREVMTPPPVDDCVAFGKLKEEHPTPDATPGTMQQARRAAADAVLAVAAARYGTYDRWLPERLVEVITMLTAHDERHDPKKGWCKCARRWEAGDGTVEVGSINNVWRLADIDHFIGMEVRTGPDGWTLEHLEMLDSTLEVLRHNGAVRGVQRGYVMRSESRGGIHYD